MAARKKYDDDFKRKALARLASETVAQIAKDTKVPSNLIYTWANKAGLSLGDRVAKKKVAKKKARHVNGNGAPLGRDPLAQVERELTAALDSVRKVRLAMAAVFGGSDGSN